MPLIIHPGDGTPDEHSLFLLAQAYNNDIQYMSPFSDLSIAKNVFNDLVVDSFDLSDDEDEDEDDEYIPPTLYLYRQYYDTNDNLRLDTLYSSKMALDDADNDINTWSANPYDTYHEPNKVDTPEDQIPVHVPGADIPLPATVPPGLYAGNITVYAHGGDGGNGVAYAVPANVPMYTVPKLYTATGATTDVQWGTTDFLEQQPLTHNKMVYGTNTFTGIAHTLEYTDEIATAVAADIDLFAVKAEDAKQKLIDIMNKLAAAPHAENTEAFVEEFEKWIHEEVVETQAMNDWVEANIDDEKHATTDLVDVADNAEDVQEWLALTDDQDLVEALTDDNLVEDFL